MSMAVNRWQIIVSSVGGNEWVQMAVSTRQIVLMMTACHASCALTLYGAQWVAHAHTPKLSHHYHASLVT